MNNIFILLIAIITVSSKAQQIIDIEDNMGYNVFGAYYKDTHNQLDAFVGTYTYTNGDDVFTLVLQKKIRSKQGIHYSEDLIIGEFKHVVDGNLVRNTLNRLDINFTDQKLHSLSGNQLIIGTALGCPDCSPSEKRLRLGFVEIVSNLLGRVQIRIMTVNGQPAIQFSLSWEMNYDGSPQAAPTLPSGRYIMMKEF